MRLSLRFCAIPVDRTHPADAARSRRTTCRLSHGSPSSPQKSKQQNYCANAVHAFFISQKDFLEQETGIQSCSDQQAPAETGAGPTWRAPEKLECSFSLQAIHLVNVTFPDTWGRMRMGAKHCGEKAGGIRDCKLLFRGRHNAFRPCVLFSENVPAETL